MLGPTVHLLLLKAQLLFMFSLRLTKITSLHNKNDIEVLFLAKYLGALG